VELSASRRIPRLDPVDIRSLNWIRRLSFAPQCTLIAAVLQPFVDPAFSAARLRASTSKRRAGHRAIGEATGNVAAAVDRRGKGADEGVAGRTVSIG